MPPMNFLMSGEATPFSVADQCPVTMGPHNGPIEQGRFMVADVAVRDGSASVRVVLWRCEPCGAVLVGLGRTDHPLDGPLGAGIHVQDFAWFEESVALIGQDESGAAQFSLPDLG